MGGGNASTKLIDFLECPDKNEALPVTNAFASALAYGRGRANALLVDHSH